MGAAGVEASSVTTVDDVTATPAFLAQSWVLGLLLALGVLAGLIAAAGMLLYLQARQQAREVSYALAVRMGLSRGAHVRSVLLEVGALLFAALAIGGALALAAAFLVHGSLDLLPEVAPPPLLRLPGVLLAATAGALAVLSLAGSWRVQRAADRANVAEVMRLAG